MTAKSAIFSVSSENSPWPIDTAQFDIVPAVPSKRATKDIKRVPRDVSENSTDDPKQLSSITAVPYATTAFDNELSRDPKHSLNISEEDAGESKYLPRGK